MSKKKKTKIIFFTDWAIGKTVPDALRAARANVEIHGDHFAPETPDTEWLPTVSQKGWIVLTKDKAIGRNPLELVAIARAKAKVFTLVSGNLTRKEMATICVNALPYMEKFVTGNQAPFIAKIYKNSQVKLWRSRTQLNKML